MTAEQSIGDSRGSVTLLVDLMRSDDPLIRGEAESEVWRRFGPMLLASIRKRLTPAIRRREDEEDIANEAFNSFCLGHRCGEFTVADREALKALLGTITRCKLRNAVERHTSRCRDYRRELNAIPRGAGSEDRSSASELLDALKAPPSFEEMEAVIGEALEPIFRAVEDPYLPQVVELLLSGASTDDIAEKLATSKRTAQRRVKAVLAKLNGLGEAS